MEEHHLRSELNQISVTRVTMEQVGSSTCLGTVDKVQVHGTKSDGTQAILNWVLKITGGDQSLVSTRQILHELETFTYVTLLPAFKNFQIQRKCTPFNAYPKVLARHRPQDNLPDEALLLENMIGKGYVINDRKQPLDYNHLQLVVKTYAEFHAISMAIKHQSFRQFEQLNNSIMYWCILTLGVDYIYDKEDYVMTSRILKLLEGDQYAEHRRLLKKYSERLFQVIQTTAELEGDDESVFCHGNSSLYNILFEYGDKTRPNLPTNVCLIDFQMLRYGSPIFDLSYFIFTATDKETRDQHYDDLINIYYRSVCERLREMGSPPEAVFPYDEFQRSLRRFSVLGYFMAQMALYTMLRTPSVNVTVEMTEEDINESFSRDAAESEALYNERIKGMLIDFVEKGYFDFLDVEYSDEDSIETYNETDDEDL